MDLCTRILSKDIVMKERYLSTQTSGTLVLHSNERIIIGKDQTVFASEKLEDYLVDDSIFNDPCGNELGRSLFFARDVEDIEIRAETGGCIDGKGWLWKDTENQSKRPYLFRFFNCKRVRLKNLTVCNAPCWAICFHNCEDVEVDGVKIDSKCSYNNDGIDIDCCRNVTVKNCDIDSGDDSVVLKSTKNIASENIRIENCRLKTHWAAFKIGTESVGDFNNITFCNNVIVSSEGCALKIVPTDGSNVTNVLIENIDILNATGPVFIANGERMRTYYAGESRSEYSTISSVTLRNIRANVYIKEESPFFLAKGCVLITGTKKNKIKGIRIEDSVFNMPGGVMGTQFTLAELGAGYPEYYALGTAPAYGAYIRHVDDCVFANVEFIPQKSDMREKIVTDDVTAFFHK